jgi:hypothetical protein
MSQQSASFYSYVNGGIEALTPIGYGSFITYINTGVEALTLSSDATTIAYINTAVAIPQQTVVVRGPHGWGMIPTGSQTVVLLTDQSKATVYAYENIT